MINETSNETAMISLGKSIGELLQGGEIIELTGDVGSGKTTLVKGIAAGLSIDDVVQSPSFMICRSYVARNDLNLAHYDFYRLDLPGIMAEELQEKLFEPKTITVIEWGSIIEGVLPDDRLTIDIKTTKNDTRIVNIKSGGKNSKKLETRINL